MKILVVGSWVTSTYEKPLFDALKETAEVRSFEWCRYFNFTPLSDSLLSNRKGLLGLWDRFQNKYIIGPALRRLNFELIQECQFFQPDLVFLYRATHVWPETVKKMTEKHKVFSYNNDDPFTAHLPQYVYRNYLKSLMFCDWNFVYREKNVKDLNFLDIKNVSILRSNYIQTLHYPMNLDEKLFDIIFIGHFESDGRDVAMLSLLKNGYKVGLFGMNWNASPIIAELENLLGYKVRAVYGAEYNNLLNQSKIALVFFSKINSDTYTRRVFEIPATKTFMLTEKTDEMCLLFNEGVEFDMFSSREELLQKVKYYLNNDIQRRNMAAAGYNRLLKDGHEISDRARQILKTFREGSSSL